MFWKFDLSAMSHVDKLLDKEGVTLRELMDGEDILQECKAQNRKLLDFLCRRQSMEELVGLVTQDPALDLEERARFKYPNTACELLTCDVPQINDRLGGDETLLNVLYNFLDREPPLNPLLASFFSKTIGNLIARKTEQVIAFLRKKDKFISLVLKHIGTSALMDLLLRLASCVEPVGLRQEVLRWLNEEKTIQRLVELIHPSQDEDVSRGSRSHLGAGAQLRAAAGALRHCLRAGHSFSDVDCHRAVTSCVSYRQECVEQLLRNMFDGVQTELCLVSGTQVLLTLLEPRRAGSEGLLDSCSQGLDRPCTVSPGVLRGIEPRLKDFHQLLLSPPKKAAILTTVGVLEEPLGNARLHSARLVAALLHTGTPSINQELCRLDTMGLLLDLFFKYTWNNFLHLQVELCIAAILSHAAREDRAAANGPEDALEPPPSSGGPAAPQPASSLPEGTMVTHLFQKCCLVQRILEAWEANDRTQAAGGMRRGNMGHLTRIANAVVQNLEGGPLQSQVSEVFRGERLQARVSLPAVPPALWPSAGGTGPAAGWSACLPRVTFPVGLGRSQFPAEPCTPACAVRKSSPEPCGAPSHRGLRPLHLGLPRAPCMSRTPLCSSQHRPAGAGSCLADVQLVFHTRTALACPARHLHSGLRRGPHSQGQLFGGPHASERCPKDGPERRGQGAGEGVDAVQAGSPCEGGSEGPVCLLDKGMGVLSPPAGSSWAVFDGPVTPMAASPAPAVARDVGSSVWAAGSPSTSAPEEKGWAKFADFQPFWRLLRAAGPVQAFSEYQVQQMTATFVDQFGFSDEEFAEQDDSVNAPFDRIAEISFSVDADDDSPGAALFEACCSDHIQPF
ncbi:PREDICTED: serine/threonine-protein phosphatase 6 regulatory subunit 2-like, partial [Bison bison bison]|uniref:Serine/threonine-protein phosphatase 6 regulatory subunit 2-like n=1 Tax=Bison bison bison TaxID=43346 RepID=A0A6P3HG55_BISBB